ncbi:MAG: hypothetical protein R6W78_06625, partial [Bacteroidales bacterium]
MKLLMIEMIERFADKVLTGIGFSETFIHPVKAVLFVLFIILLSWLVNYIAKQGILVVLGKII